MKKTSEIAKFLINDHHNEVKYRNLPVDLKPKDINDVASHDSDKPQNKT